MDIIAVLSRELEIKRSQAEAAVRLMDEGNTVPFIARYRKEATGALSDVKLRELEVRLKYLRNLEDRRNQILETIREQGKMTLELEKDLFKAETLTALEDLYRPFKQKRRTRALIAREKGLGPLAELILDEKAKGDLTLLAGEYVDPEKELFTPEDVIAGASDIVAEEIANRADIREALRDYFRRQGQVVSAKDKGAGETAGVYENYYDFSEPVRTIPGHRILALNRGEKEKALSVRIEGDKEQILRLIAGKVIKRKDSPQRELLCRIIEDAYSRLIESSVEREIRGELTAKAQEGALVVFRENLRQLLMQPPIKGKVVLGWDPAFRTGCKLAVADPGGKILDTAVIYPTAPTNDRKKAEAQKVLARFIKKYNVTLFSVGNGTASRESEQFIAEFFRKIPEKVQYIITNEAGASVYSAGELADQEFPEFDVGLRSAASIARRAQDPLSELVKIDPGSIGVGQYQHDMDQKQLKETLSKVVEDCVNSVGVDLNTASPALLSYVAGINAACGANIVTYREQNGSFRNRRELLKVPKLGPKTFEQCAGFLRIIGGTEPLDATGVHPENYGTVRKLAKKYHLEENSILGSRIRLSEAELSDLAKELEVGELTLKDILGELEKPGRDPRDEMQPPVLRSDVLSLSDLKEGMVLKGTVRNVVDFGAFVDIGVHEDGLVHISRLTRRKFVKHPLEVVSVGDIVKVKVLEIDEKKKRIALSMKDVEED